MADFDDIKESHNKIPTGWLAFYIGLIIWLIYYCIAFTPEISGWSWYHKFDAEMKQYAPAKKAETAAPAALPKSYAGDQKAIAEGKAIYEANCSACHGADLKGTGIGPNLLGVLPHGGDEESIYHSVADGLPGTGMPPFGQQLGADKSMMVVAYLMSARPASAQAHEEAEAPAHELAEGKALYEANCVACHGANLKGGIGPDLTGTLKYGDSRKDIAASISGGRKGGMPAFGQMLGAMKVKEIAMYVQSMRPKK